MNEVKTDKKTGRAARLTTFQNGFSVETWWNRAERGYCIQVKDADGNQVGNYDFESGGESEYRGHWTTARLTHQSAVERVTAMFTGGPHPTTPYSEAKRRPAGRIKL